VTNYAARDAVRAPPHRRRVRRRAQGRHRAVQRRQCPPEWRDCCPSVACPAIRDPSRVTHSFLGILAAREKSADPNNVLTASYFKYNPLSRIEISISGHDVSLTLNVRLELRFLAWVFPTIIVTERSYQATVAGTLPAKPQLLAVSIKTLCHPFCADQPPPGRPFARHSPPHLALGPATGLPSHRAISNITII